MHTQEFDTKSGVNYTVFDGFEKWGEVAKLLALYGDKVICVLNSDGVTGVFYRVEPKK